MKPAAENKRIAIVTGAGRASGIGFEVCRQLAERGISVLLTGREPRATGERAQELRREGLDVRAQQLDVTDERSILALVQTVTQDFGRVDILVNNAAATSAYGERPSTTDLERARAGMDVTLFGAWRLTQAMLPLILRATSGRVVNVSSGAGSHVDPAFGLETENAMGPAYAVAKAALNALTVTFAKELRPQKILVNAVCPGFTATFPGGDAMGARPVREGARGVIWAAMLDDDGPTGGFFRDGKALPW